MNVSETITTKRLSNNRNNRTDVPFLDLRTVLADVLAERSELIPVLNRFGIRLGVGDKNIRQLCRENELNPDFILTVLNVYLDENYLPDKNLLLFDAELIADYFKHTIDNYVQDLVPNIEKHLNAFIALSGSENKELSALRGLFYEFKQQLSNHFQNGINQDDDFPDELLHDLKNILIKHVSGKYNQNLCHAVIFSLHSFEKDLIVHNRLRTKILRPKLKELNLSDINHLQQVIAEENVLNGDKSGALTKREVEVLKLISKGFINKEIADELNISLNTVLTHRKNIIAKTGIKTVSGLTIYCISKGLLSPDSQLNDGKN